METIDLSGLTEHSVSTEVIQPGDVLDVSMVNDYSKLTTTTTPVRVADDGTIIVPLVGQVNVGGMEVVQAEQLVNAQSVMRGIFRNPCITMTMRQCRTRKVTVVGAVNKPGTGRFAARSEFADDGAGGRRRIDAKRRARKWKFATPTRGNRWSAPHTRRWARTAATALASYQQSPPAARSRPSSKWI